MPLPDIANKILVRVMGLRFNPTELHTNKASQVLRQHRRDDDDEHDVDPRAATVTTSNRIFDDAARKVGLYRVRSNPLPIINEARDDCLLPLANRHGIGYEGAISHRSDTWRGDMVFVPARRAGAEAMVDI